MIYEDANEMHRAWLCTVNFTVGQMLAVLATVDYKGVKELVEAYVDRWEVCMSFRLTLFSTPLLFLLVRKKNS